MWSSTGKIGARGFRSPFAHGEFTAGQWFSVLPLPMANAFLPTQRMPSGCWRADYPATPPGPTKRCSLHACGWYSLTVVSARAGQCYRVRWRAKKSVRRRLHAADSSGSTRLGGITSGRWLSRRSRTTSHRDPTAPARSSRAP